eukprot:gene990-342_t
MATTDKYDRQLRLWGAHGQRALGTAKVCVLVGEGSGALATETLKNLVLPGIGEFIFVDGAVVTERDLGSNFFVEGEALGQSRAECCTRLLKELNPDVQGNYVNESVAKILETKPEFLEQFQLVIACRLDDTLQQKVEEKCRQAGVPVVIQNILGFFGQLRLCLMEHCVVEGKPDNEVVDLRILNPFPQLSELVNKVDLEKMDDAQHAHVPYSVERQALNLMVVGSSPTVEMPHFEKRVRALTDIYNSNFTVADLYEAWALYCFATLCISYIGLIRATAGDHAIVKPLQDILLSGIMVFVLVTAAQSFLKLGIGFAESTIGLDVCDVYPEVCRLDGPFVGAGFVASTVAIYDIIIVEREFSGDMTTFQPGAKFLATKALVSLAFLQQVGLAAVNVFIPLFTTPQESLFYSSLICYEVFVISLFHVFSWSPGAPWYEKMTELKRQKAEIHESHYQQLIGGTAKAEEGNNMKRTKNTKTPNTTDDQ